MNKLCSLNQGLNHIQEVRFCIKWSLENVYGYDAWKREIVGLEAFLVKDVEVFEISKNL